MGRRWRYSRKYAPISGYCGWRDRSNRRQSWRSTSQSGRYTSRTESHCRGWQQKVDSGYTLLFAEYMGLEPGIAERAARVEPFLQTNEVGMTLVERGDGCRIRQEDLAPVWASMEWCQGLLDLSHHLLNCCWLAPPGEMDSDGVLLIAHTHPELIGGHAANLAHQQDWSHPVREGAHGFYGFQSMLMRQKVLRLDFLSVAGCVTHAEMRQTIRPETGPTQLRRTRGRIQFDEGMPINCCGHCAEEVGINPIRVIHPALDPDLLIGLAPASEDADAIAAGSDLVEMVIKRLPTEVFKHPLLHFVGRLHVQSDARDCTEGTQSNHEAIEVRIASGCLDDFPVGRHDFQPRDSSSEITIGDA